MCGLPFLYAREVDKYGYASVSVGTQNCFAMHSPPHFLCKRQCVTPSALARPVIAGGGTSGGECIRMQFDATLRIEFLRDQKTLAHVGGSAWNRKRCSSGPHNVAFLRGDTDLAVIPGFKRQVGIIYDHGRLICTSVRIFQELHLQSPSAGTQMVWASGSSESCEST